MMPTLMPSAVISFLAMSISWWTTPSSSSRMDWTSSPIDRWVGGVLGSFVVLIMVGAYRRGRGARTGIGSLDADPLALGGGRARARGARTAHHHRGGDGDVAGGHLVTGDPFDDELRGQRPQPLGVRIHAGDLGDPGGGQRGVAVAGDGELVGNRVPGFPGGGQHPHRGDVIGAGDSGGHL